MLGSHNATVFELHALNRVVITFGSIPSTEFIGRMSVLVADASASILVKVRFAA